MKFWKSNHPRRGAGQAVILLMLSLWVVTIAGAMSPAVHQLLHADAQDANHQCLITQFQQGSMPEAAGTFITLPPAPADFAIVRCPDFEFGPIISYGFSPSRAPPSFLSSVVVVG